MTDILEAEAQEFEIKVSSVLNRQVREYGKMFMFDGREDTCWNSDQGTPQWVKITFDREVKPTELQIMFQGGFVGKTCWIEVSKNGEDFEKLLDIYPEDINRLQTFPIPPDSQTDCQAFKVVFADSTDFFGRVTIYQMKLLA